MITEDDNKKWHDNTLIVVVFCAAMVALVYRKGASFLTIDTRNIGLDLAVIGSAISIIGVILNNIFLNHVAAMQVWVVSNLIFVIYFYGRRKQYWDGGLCDAVMCGMYCVMLVSGVWGLMQ